MRILTTEWSHIVPNLSIKCFNTNITLQNTEFILLPIVLKQLLANKITVFLRPNLHTVLLQYC